MEEFKAAIKKEGINPYVEVPKPVAGSFGKRGYIYVEGKVNEFPIEATLVPKSGGRYYLHINGEVRKGAGVDTGDTITVTLEESDGPRTLPMIPEFQKALDLNPKAKANYERMPPSHRREYLAYLSYLKTPEALHRNIKKAIRMIAKWQ